MQHAAIAGILLHGFYLGGVFWALSHGMPATVAALIASLQPVIVALLAGPLLRTHHIFAMDRNRPWLCGRCLCDWMGYWLSYPPWRAAGLHRRPHVICYRHLLPKTIWTRSPPHTCKYHPSHRRHIITFISFIFI